MHFNKLLAVALVAVCSAAPRDFSEHCDFQNFDNGAGFATHPESCDKFIQCWTNGLGQMVGMEMSCGFGTYWKNSDLACVAVNQASCLIDKCKYEADGTVFKADTNCRGFWKCAGGKSVPACCPSGQHYEENGGCVKNMNGECKVQCIHEYVPPMDANDTMANMTTESMPVETTTEAQCIYEEVFDEANAYYQYVHGMPIKMLCAPGSVFNASACGCVHQANAEAIRCRPDLHLTFTNGAEDMSNHHSEVQNTNVFVDNGQAGFNGMNSELVIRRYTNVDINTALYIRVKYVSNHDFIPAGESRAILSDSDCSYLPTIYIAENKTHINAGVKNVDAPMAWVSLPHDVNATSGQSEKDVAFHFNAVTETLSLSYGGQTSTVAVAGNQMKIACALHVGQARGSMPFRGTIDELAIYMCEPNTMP